MNKRQKKTLANVIIVALIVGGVVWIGSIFVHIGGEYTNNAQVQRDMVEVSARVQGFVERVYVGEYCHVERGDTLLTIDDSEYRLHLAQAEATLANMREGKSASGRGEEVDQNRTRVIDANISELEVLLSNAETDYKRFNQLYEQGAATRQQYEQAETNYRSLKAKVETLRRERDGARIATTQSHSRTEQQQANIDAAQAAVDLARLNLSYCTVVAPCSGYTGRKMVKEGEMIAIGAPLFTIVDDSDCWVVANYRETQCGDIAVGRSVKIKVDAMPKVEFAGVVVALSQATGARYAVAAPDNAVGSYVKVEQRVPVKIAFTADNDSALIARLTAGMNVECTVK